jgi:uncharacterized membrane protein YdjX (TVP38/TMEM64 family)
VRDRQKSRCGETLITCKDTPAGPNPLARLGLFAVLIAATLAFFLFIGRHFISLQTLAEHRLALRALVAENFAPALVLYSLTYMLAVVLMFPAAAVLTLAGGFLFGWAIGSTLTVLSATTGATLVFLIARTALGENLVRRAGPWLCKLQAGFRKDALSYLLFLRLVPAFPFWFMNLAPAVLGVSLRDFVLATAVGIVPGTLAFSFVGAGLDGVLAEHYQTYLACLAQNVPPPLHCHFGLTPRSFLTRELLAALLLLGMVAILPAIVKRLWKSKASRA